MLSARTLLWEQNQNNIAAVPEYHSPVASGLSKAAVYRLAENIARQLQYRRGSNILDVIRRLGGRVSYRPASQLEDGTTGSIEILGEGDFDIFLPHHTSITRDYFTICHEIGHYILHFLLPLKSQGNDLAPMRSLRYGTGREEWESNWFSAAFLMPEEEFRSAFNTHDGDLSEVASIFSVSIAAAKVRAMALGLL